MGLIAAVLIPIVLFFWLAFCFTIWSWLQAIVCLCQCKFIGASLWLNAGVAMLLWWTGKWESWDAFLPGAVFFIGVGALGTFMRYHLKRKSMSAIPAWTTPADAEIELVVPAQQILELDKSEYRSIQ